MTPTEQAQKIEETVTLMFEMHVLPQLNNMVRSAIKDELWGVVTYGFKERISTDLALIRQEVVKELVRDFAITITKVD